MGQAVAIELDGILTDLACVMNARGIVFDPARHSLANPLLKQCLYDYECGALTPTGRAVFGAAEADPDAAELLGFLRAARFTVYLITERDLRLTGRLTAGFLHKNALPYDFLFQVDDRARFCREMGVAYLLSPRPVIKSDTLCFAPDLVGPSCGAHIYHQLLEVKQWMQKK